MKTYIFLLMLTVLVHASTVDSNVTTNNLSVEEERPSRLEAGYGSDEIFSETLPYMHTFLHNS